MHPVTIELEKITIGRKTLKLDLGDITRVRTDAIVNAANTELSGGGGVDGAIHRAAGPTLMAECRRHKGCPTGTAVMTPAGNLPVNFLIHTAGPIWSGGQEGEAELLASCYESCLELAQQKSISSLAFPSISTGSYGYPVELAGQIALNTVKTHLEGNTVIEEVVFILHDENTFLLYQKILIELS
jgi:O-acetyl-ADP-ribose deacetylase (regulator of RNase III)